LLAYPQVELQSHSCAAHIHFGAQSVRNIVSPTGAKVQYSRFLPVELKVSVGQLRLLLTT
jgi:hypothetical protein